MVVSFKSVFEICNLQRLKGEKQENKELQYSLVILHKALLSGIDIICIRGYYIIFRIAIKR
jgi:hypothetical protein